MVAVITKENLYEITAVISERFSLVTTNIRNTEDKLTITDPQKISSQVRTLWGVLAGVIAWIGDSVANYT